MLVTVPAAAVHAGAAVTTAAAVAATPLASGAVPGDAPTPCAVNVQDFGAGTGAADDSAAFESAMAAAVEAEPTCNVAGPTGAAQGVVYVPAGTYPLLFLTFPSNVRMEVDAGAVLQQAGGLTPPSPAAYPTMSPNIILWDAPGGSPLTNVSLVGVGTAPGGIKSAANPVAPAWSVDNDFTFDLDPQATNSSNLTAGLVVMNVEGFLVANVFSIQNDTQPTATERAASWPTTARAALVLRQRNDSPRDYSAFYDPHDGVVTNWYNIHGPRGDGPNQVNSGHNLTFSQIYSQGGTTLRIETDNSNQKQFGGEVRTVMADHIVGVDCNRAVSFAPHWQNNYDVHVTDVTATGCTQGVVESGDESIPRAKRGGFFGSTISNVTVASGPGAQIPLPHNANGWTTGTSYQAFGRDKADTWSVVYDASLLTCGGSFQAVSDAIQTTGGVFRPTCASHIGQPTVPGAPKIGVAKIKGLQATVSFSPTDEGGSPITGYTVTSTPEGNTVTGTSSPITFPGLTGATAYTFTVHATNSVGDGRESAPSNSVTAVDPPAPSTPTGVNAIVTTGNRVQVAWTRANGATSYAVSRAVSSDGPYSVIGTSTSVRYTDVTVSRGTTYYYSVQGVSSVGNSVPSAPVSATTRS